MHCFLRMMDRLKKIISALGIFFVLALPLAAVPQVARAEAPVATIIDLPRIAEWIGKVWDDYVKDALIQGAATILINTMTYAADRIAYDAAVYISSGGAGEDPLFDNSTVGAYMANYGASVAGEALSQIDESGLLGNFKICDPTGANVTIAFKFGLKSAFDRQDPGCDIKEVAANWEGFIADISSTFEGGDKKTAAILTQLSDMYNPQTNDFSAGIQLYTNVLSQAQQKSFLEAQKHLLRSGFKDKTDFLTGKVDTPAELLQHNLEDNLKKPEDTREQIGTVILGSSDNILLQMGIHAGSVFANTLISKGVQRIYDGLFSNLDEVEIDPFSEIAYSSSNAQDARASFGSFLAAAPLEVTNYSILKEFASCPSVGRGLYNCVADASFVSGVARADSGSPLTVQEALDEGLLHSDWALIPSSDEARDQDAYCYSYGYCHSNLVKLRKARIFPIGWELAAESGYHDESDPVTLGEVVAGFDDCGSSNEATQEHPWCHLIDPDWVLKYPDTQCRAQVFGQLLSNPSSDQRDQECVDMPSCIDEDDDGTCSGGYGYCVREENVWRFRGEECPDYYATCISYEDSTGEDVAYLSNTLDSGVCAEDNAGCLWYATTQDETSGSLDWPDYSTATLLASAESASDAYAERIYFTSAVEDCDAESAGCRELALRDEDLSLNMVINPSFEDDDDSDGQPDAWFTSDTSLATYSDDGSASLDGSAAVNPSSVSYYQDGLVLGQGRTYTFSYFSRLVDSTSATAKNTLTFEGEDGTTIDFTGIELSGDCSIGSSDNVLSMDEEPTSTTYERFSCSMSVPTLSNAAEWVLVRIDLAGDLWFDEIQLEQATEASDYHKGYNDLTLTLAYVKTPPDYLGCTGDDGEPEACDDYVAVCEEQDVGCSEYTPTNGDPSIIGVANPLDECPSTCVGYDTFKQEATLYEPEGNFPVYFIPNSAEECTEEAVGCDEFTNESTEELAYFTYLRACVTESQAASNISGDDAATFYTWEGSDLDGYQLVTWRLIQSDLASSSATSYTAPCTNWTSSSEGITCDDDGDGDPSTDGDPVDTSEDCDEHNDVLTNPDCREFYDVEGTIYYREWSSTVTVDNACVTYRKTDIVGDDATEQGDNCENSGGYFDTTSGVCRYYGFADESNTCTDSNAGCREYTGGRSRNSRQAFVEYFESDTLESWDTSTPENVTLSNESVATDGHSLASDGVTVWTYVATQSSECTDEGGCAGSAGNLGGTCTIAYGETTCGTLDGQIFDGKTYTLSFWAKGTGTIGVGFDTQASASAVKESTVDAFFETSVELEEGWNEYALGPLSINEADFSDGTVLAFVPASGVSFYIDNIVLREGEDNITVIKDSWTTPAECDETPEGTDSAQYYLGCAEYTDQEGDTAYLKSFSSLCSEDQVGCASYFMTQESDATNAQVFNAVCSNDPEADGTSAVATSATDCYWGVASSSFDTASRYLCTIGVGNTQCAFDMDFFVPAANLPDHVSYSASTHVVPADREVFLVVNSDVECSGDVAGCEEVGLPVFSQDHTTVDSWTSTYFINDPDTYAETLCTSDELFCEAWQETDGDMAYFKNPQDQTCEYKTDVMIDGVTYDGWFKTGTTELCYEDYVIGGDVGGIWRNGDDDYDNWVGNCEEKYDACTEFQDLTDLTQEELYADADGESYYYLNDDTLDQESLPDSEQCNDQVGQKDGCGLFNDTGEPNKAYATSPSYILSIHADELLGQAPNSLVTPVDCESGSDASTYAGIDLCEQRCAYVEGDLFDLSDSDSTDYAYDGSCYENSDCRPLFSEVGETVEGTCINAGSDNRIQNDANVVLKVNRDRECSEWLSCSDTTTTWDERTNSFKTICNDIELCTEYSTTGNSSFCSEWKFDDVETVLNEDKYTTRDVTWYGEEYSGYAIPDVFPVQTLAQVNVAPPLGTCNLLADYQLGDVSESTWSTYQGAECTTDEECGASGDLGDGWCVAEEEEDYRLAYVAGSCEDGVYGEACSVGYCSDSGAACTESDDCNDGASCLVGDCLDVSTNLACEIDSDCTDDYYNTCITGACTAITDSEMTIEEYDNGDMSGYSCSTPRLSVAAKPGSCIRSSCVLTPDGNTFDVDDSEQVACRAYPEMNSPFPTEIVEEWTDIDDSHTVTSDPEYGALPWSYRSNFSSAKTCVQGEDCDCSYKKVTFGSGTTKYFGDETDFPIEAASDGKVGVCVGGEWDGAFCSSDTNYASDSSGTSPYAGSIVWADSYCEDGGGSCQYASKSENVLGLDGYCLERDSGMTILGDREQRACLTWLPVDQLAGSSDLYAKYTSAGFFEETEYCASVSLFADMSPTTAYKGGDYTFGEGAMILCAEADGSLSDDPYCDGAVACPPGNYAVLGPRFDSFTKDNYSYTCAEHHAGDDDCPFVCVPVGAEDENGACDDDGVPVDSYGADDIGEEVYSGWSFDQFYIDDPADFTAYAEDVQDCSVKGRKMVDGSDALNVTVPWYIWDSSFASSGTSYGNQTSEANVYVGCDETAVVMSSASDNQAAPYTDRILNENYVYTVEIGSAYDSSYAYKANSARTPFGRTISTSGENHPPVVAACVDEVEDGGYYYTYRYIEPDIDLDCPTDYEAEDNNGISSFTNPESRTFTDFRLEFQRIKDNPDKADSEFTGGWTGFYDAAFSRIDESGSGSSDDGTSWSYIVSELFATNNLGKSYDDGVYIGGASSAGAAYHDTEDVVEGSFEESTDSKFIWDYRAESGTPPSVYALDLDNCENDVCEEDDDHNLTLNEQNSGDVNGSGFFRAYLKFYAAAYKEQLPIRRVIIDWQDKANSTDDQVGSESDNNYYKNHRGLKNNTEQSICDTEVSDASYEWGMNNDSCDPYYFTYSHIYSCTASILSDAEACADADDDGNLDTSPCQNSRESCSFQPRVHVRDNWGLCTGTCNSGSSRINTDVTDNCVDNDGTISGTDDDDECDYTLYTDSTAETDPWVYYDGVVTVTP